MTYSMAPIKMVTIVPYLGRGTSFKLGIRILLTIKKHMAVKITVMTIFGIIDPNNVNMAMIPPAAVIGTPTK